MTFSRKIFVSVFLATLIAGSGLIWVAHRYVSNQTHEEYVSRYTTFSQVLGGTLSRLDTHTEALMLNAAKVIEAQDAEKGLLSTEELRAVAPALNVTHIFVLDDKGRFIRSTNEDPRLIPNAFTFCPAYRNMILGSTQVEATPIIHPQPEPKPFKFLYIPTRNRKKMINVGLRVDFVAKTLTEALGSDSNLLSMALYAPDGTSFGRFNSKDVQFNENRFELPSSLPAVVDTGSALKFYAKVQSSHPKCCQCDVAGTSRNGEYFYILESEVSKRELAAVKAKTTVAFAFLAFANLILALLISRILSRKLVKNIEIAAKKVQKMKEHGDFDKRIRLKGADEIVFLSREFDRLLDSLEDSQKKIVEAEKIQAKIQMAREVAHNIKSPIVTLEMMRPMLSPLADGLKKVFNDSISEIKGLCDRLTRQADTLAGKYDPSAAIHSVDIQNVIERLVNEKRIEFSGRSGVRIELSLPVDQEILVRVDPIEFRALLSNLINNAIDAYSGDDRLINVSVSSVQNGVRISVKDFGRGMSSELLGTLGKEPVSQNKNNGKGLGFFHAHKTMEEWTGNIDVKSEIGIGTEVSLFFPTTDGTTIKA